MDNFHVTIKADYADSTTPGPERRFALDTDDTGEAIRQGLERFTSDEIDEGRSAPIHVEVHATKI